MDPELELKYLELLKNHINLLKDHRNSLTLLLEEKEKYSKLQDKYIEALKVLNQYSGLNNSIRLT